MVKSVNRELLIHFARRIFTTYPEIAVGIMKIFYEELGGCRISIPTLKDLAIEERDQRIRNRFKGFNHQELADLFGLSVRQIRRIVNQ